LPLEYLKEEEEEEEEEKKVIQVFSQQSTIKVNLQSFETGPAEQLAGGSFSKSCNSLLIRFRAIYIILYLYLYIKKMLCVYCCF
jgi:hypothetical protein